MSLIGTLNIGKSALATHQASIQVTGNNIANAGNADYTRQTGHVTPGADRERRQITVGLPLPARRAAGIDPLKALREE